MDAKRKRVKKDLKNKKDKQPRKKSTSVGIVGLILGRNFIRIWQKKPGKIIVDEILLERDVFEGEKLKDREEFINALQLLLKRNGILKAKIAFCCLNSKILIKKETLSLDKFTTQNIREKIYLELGDTIQLPFEAPIFDILEVEREDSFVQPTISSNKLLNEIENDDKEEEPFSKSSNLGFLFNKKKTKAPNQEQPTKKREITLLASSEVNIIEICEAIKDAHASPVAVGFSSLVYTQIFKDTIKWEESFLLLELDGGKATLTIYEQRIPIHVQYEDYNQQAWEFMTNEEEGLIVAQYDKGTEIENLKNLGNTLLEVKKYYDNILSKGKKLSTIYLVGGHPKLEEEVQEVLKQMISFSIIPLSKKHSEVSQERIPDRFLLAAGLSEKRGF